MSTSRSALVDWLRRCSDDDLARLLAARPDLLHPVPSDVDVLANRATGRASVEIALDRLDVGTLHVVEAFALVPEPTDPEAIATALGVTVEAVTAPIARLRQAMLVWGRSQRTLAGRRRPRTDADAGEPRPTRAHVARAVAGGQLARLVVDLGLDHVGDRQRHRRRCGGRGFDALADVLEDPQQISSLLDRVPPAARDVLDLLASGPPTGRVPSARRPVTAATADSPVRWLLAHGLLIAVDDFTVVLPREVALVVRGGHAFRRRRARSADAEITKATSRRTSTPSPPGKRSPSSGWSKHCLSVGASSRRACCEPAAWASANCDALRAISTSTSGPPRCSSR